MLPSSDQDSQTTLGALRQAVAAFSEERDWFQFHTPKNLSMAIAAESGELMEHFLWKPSDDRSLLETASAKEKIEDELADIIIYSLQFANVAEVDLTTAIRRKMARNAEKYPVEKARGRSDKYTEL